MIRVPEPTLHVDPSWGGLPLIRWRGRWGSRNAFAAWWLHNGHNFYTRALKHAKAWALRHGADP